MKELLSKDRQYPCVSFSSLFEDSIPLQKLTGRIKLLAPKKQIMKKKDQPHDRYLKDLLQDIDLARAFLLNYLDQDIREKIDWATLTLYDVSLT